MTPEQAAEYEICKRRGHQPGSPTPRTGMTLASTRAAVRWASQNPHVDQTCRWCGTRYHYENVLVERTG